MKRKVFNQHRLLLVEDDASLVLTLTDLLASKGYHVESVQDGQFALDRASDGGHDLVILDVMLPHKDGFEICRALRRRGVHTPIIMLTARGQVQDRVSGLKLGADDYLANPLSLLNCWPALKHCCAGRLHPARTLRIPLSSSGT